MHAHAIHRPPDRLAPQRSQRSVEESGILALQRTAGNRAVARHLRASRPLIARKWNAEAEKAFAKLPSTPPDCAAQFEELGKLIESYRRLPETEVTDQTLGMLGRIVELAVVIRESKKIADGDLLKTLSEVITAARQEQDLARYRVQKEATTAAFKTGVPSYLNITPEAGGREALATGKEGRYPESLPLPTQYRATAPTDTAKDLDIEITGPGGIIDLLVVSGGHGGVGSIFEGDDPTRHLEADWWKAQAEALAKRNVKAKLIVLDACLTASMVPAFLPLLTGDGKIIGYVHSIPQMTMTSEVWEEVIKQGPAEIEKIIDARIAALVKAHEESRHGTTLEPTIAVAIYRADRGALHYDEQALDDTRLAGLSGAKEKAELGQMKRALGSQKAKPMSAYSPSIGKPESGTPVASASRVVKRADWEKWLNDSYIVMTPGDAAPDVDASVYEIETNAEWTVKAADGDSMTLEPAA